MLFRDTGSELVTVMYLGAEVQIPQDNFYWLCKRGHIIHVYGSTPRVKPSMYLELVERDMCETTAINRDKAYE